VIEKSVSTNDQFAVSNRADTLRAETNAHLDVLIPFGLRAISIHKHGKRGNQLLFFELDDDRYNKNKYI
jgi:hypothetical protein